MNYERERSKITRPFPGTKDCVFPALKVLNLNSFFGGNCHNLPGEIDSFFPLKYWLNSSKFFSRDYMWKRLYFSIYVLGAIYDLFQLKSVVKFTIIYLMFFRINFALILIDPMEWYTVLDWPKILIPVQYTQLRSLLNEDYDGEDAKVQHGSCSEWRRTGSHTQML